MYSMHFPELLLNLDQAGKIMKLTYSY